MNYITRKLDSWRILEPVVGVTPSENMELEFLHLGALMVQIRLAARWRGCVMFGTTMGFFVIVFPGLVW